MDVHVAFALRLLLATLLGGVIGLQRELAGKAAGLRTNLLICLGSALLTQISLQLPASLGIGDPARIAAQIVSGIGFLGAGSILQSRHAVHGLTTAATIWVVAAVGMAVGAGFERSAALATLIILLALIFLGKAEKLLLGQETVAVTFRLADGSLKPEDLVRQLGIPRNVLYSHWARREDGSATLAVSFRGSASDARDLSAAAEKLEGVEVRGWEVEE